jgi:hypothetical protein
MHSSFLAFATPMKNAAVKRVQRRVLAAAGIAACLAVGVNAQETVPETPPELKDFRLDTPAPKEKQPEAQPPPLAKTVPAPAPQPERSLSQPRSDRPAQQRAVPASPTREQAGQADAPEAAAPEAAPYQTAPDPALEPQQGSDAAPTVESTTPEPPAVTSDWTRYWPFGLALLAALLGLFGYRAWRSKQPAREELVEFASEPDFAPILKQPEPVELPPALPAIEPHGALTASFEPADARLSIANLTVTGCLRLRYEGSEPLQSLRLRNMVISACEGQRAMIDAFHNDNDAGQIDILSGAQPGEEIVLTLELQVPREALQAFDWQERRFVAPILLLNVGSDDPAVTPCRVNCLVGQQGDPLSPKMRPLPVDRGPKRFEELRFRSIAA